MARKNYLKVYEGNFVPIRINLWLELGIDKKKTRNTSIVVLKSVSICVSENFSISWLEKVFILKLGGKFCPKRLQ